MDINELIAIVKKKLQNGVKIENFYYKEKSFFHKKYAGKQKGKFQLKNILKSKELKKISKIESNKKNYKVLSKEIKTSIHSLQILIF